MTRAELIERVWRQAGVPRRVADEVVRLVFDGIVEALEREERVDVRGFGNFTVRHYRPFEAHNPRTGEHIAVPPRRRPFFRPGKELLARVNARDDSRSNAPASQPATAPEPTPHRVERKRVSSARLV